MSECLRGSIKGWLPRAANNLAGKTVEEVLRSIASYAGRLAVLSLNKLLDQTDPESASVRREFLNYWVVFDTREEILQLLRRLEETRDQLQRTITTGIRELSILIQHRDIDLKLRQIVEHLEMYLAADDQSREFTRKEFLNACQLYDPKGLLVAYHKIITTKDVTGHFLGELVEHCEYQPFLQWCDIIALNALCAYLCAMQKLHVVLEDGKVTKGTLHKQDQRMAGQLEEILKAIKAAQIQYAKKAFIDKTHGQQPSDFVRLVDNFMINSDALPKTANQRLAESLGAELAERYPWYAWAVVIAEDNPRWRNFMAYSEDFQENLFLKESVHQQFMPLFGRRAAPRPVLQTIVAGDSYGIFTCKRKFYTGGKLAHQRRLTVM
ncbi:uncharacterized protein LOC129598857 [Paramacrobiotus metropolitanus]|uniref:uncharacterized protein LOC129598857 n=1 Tax=Paramacrobiotus metropolitanus TaxID=2943436 RepID=UPI0024458CBB|nr:uncharacterized protein LOC129598857 [Paramacrobiotus metropolitanus]